MSTEVVAIHSRVDAEAEHDAMVMLLVLRQAHSRRIPQKQSKKQKEEKCDERERRTSERKAFAYKWVVR